MGRKLQDRVEFMDYHIFWNYNYGKFLLFQQFQKKEKNDIKIVCKVLKSSFSLNYEMSHKPKYRTVKSTKKKKKKKRYEKLRMKMAIVASISKVLKLNDKEQKYN